MRLRNLVIAGAVVTAGLASTPALAQHHHGGVRFGFSFGAPLYWGPGYYYPPPYYYPPAYYPPSYYPPAAVAPSPPAYVERNDPADEAQNAWYYCAEAKAYYPYVKQCPGGWQRVAPRPG